MPGNSLIGNLAVNLTLETAAFQRGATIAEKRTEAMRSRFAAATKSVSGFGAALGVGIGVAALSNVARGAFEMASALSESAEKVGVSVEALQELRFAAQQTGVSEDQLAAALNRLNKSMGELQLGKKGAVDAFAQIGLAADDLKGKAPEEALRIIADALNKLPDVQQRVAVGSQIMGKGFAQLLPLINGGSAALDNYAAEAEKAGIITSDEAKRLDDMADSWDRTKLKITVATAKIIAWFDSLEKGVIQWYAFRDRVLGAVGDMVTGIGRILTDRLNAIWDNVSKKIDWIGGKFRWLYNVVVGNSYIPDMVAGIATEMAKLDALMVQPATAGTDAVAAAFEALQNKASSLKGLLSELYPEAAAHNDYLKDVEELNQALKDGTLSAEQYKDALDRLNARRGASSGQQAGTPLTGDLTGLDTAAVQKAMDEAIAKTQQWREALSQVGRDLAEMTGDWLASFVEGSAKLKDLWKGIAAYAIRALTSQNGPLQAIFGGARASGGPVVRGKGYLVGENGPEWFSPGTSGKIIPNDKLHGVMGGGVVQNWNIVTPDADSFRRNQRQIGRDARRSLAIQ